MRRNSTTGHARASTRMAIAAAVSTVAIIAAVAAGQTPSCPYVALAEEPAATEGGDAHQVVDDSQILADELDAARAAYASAVPQESGSCLVCHSDLDMLEQSKSGDDIDAAQYLVDPEFATTTHGMLGCTYCHGGHPEYADAAAAMANMIARPTKDGGSTACGTCHSAVVEKFATSLHFNTNGLQIAWQNRLASASEHAGVDLASQYYHHDGYEGSCIDCHATCGECHVRSTEDLIDPNTGLLDGHNFVTATTNEQVEFTCMSCHAGSIGGCFTNYDVHGVSGMGMSCMDCHNIDEVHGDGVARDTMSHSGAITTECIDCHSIDGLEGQWNSEAHMASNECWACHTSNYRTCESCHGWFAPTRDDVPIEMHEDCYLGYDLSNGKITTLVKAPVDAGMLGDSTNLMLDDADLNNHTTWYIGFTHGVIVPELNQEFCDRCHGEGTELLNEGDLQYPDYEREQMVAPLPEVNVEDYL